MFRYKKYVYQVYKERSFSKAAEVLHISQPSLSATIRKAEDNLGQPIFDRSNLPIRPTEIGIRYIHAIEQIMDIEMEFAHSMDNMETLKSGSISVGTNRIFASLFFPEIVGAFSRRFPGISINITEGSAMGIEKQLLEGNLDITLDNLDCQNNNLERMVVGSETILLSADTTILGRFYPPEMIHSYDDIRNGGNEDGSWAGVSLEPLGHERFLLLSEGSDTRKRVNQMFSDFNIWPEAIIEVEQMATAYLLQRTNPMISFISDTLVRNSPEIPSLSYCKIASPQSQRSIVISRKRARYMTKAAETFLDHIREFHSRFLN